MEEYRRIAHERWLKTTAARPAEKPSPLLPIPQTLSEVVQCDHSPHGKCLKCCNCVIHPLGNARSVSGVFGAVFRREKVSNHFNRLSGKERGGLGAFGLDEHSFTYGEVRFWSFYEILHTVSPVENEVFVDLGCGVGKAVVCAALCFPGLECRGVEYMPDLIRTAEEKLDAAKAIARENNVECKGLDRVVYFRGNLAAEESAEVWKTADIVFIASTCFSDEFMRVFTRLAEKNLCRGCRVVSLSKKIDSSRIVATKESLFRMSWGNCAVYFHQVI